MPIQLFNFIESALLKEKDHLPLALWRGRPLGSESTHDAQLRYTSLGLTLSHLAALKCDITSLLFLKELGDDFLTPDFHGFLPSHFAAFHKNTQIRDFFNDFEEIPVKSMLTPPLIRALTRAPKKGFIPQNYWHRDALYFALATENKLTTQTIPQNISEPLSIEHSSVVGFNVIANCFIEENVIVGTYDGEVSIGPLRVSAYICGEFFNTAQGNLVVDGISYRSMGCLFNDSLPNVAKEVVIDAETGLPRIIFRTLRPISAGESITWSYGPNHLTRMFSHAELQPDALEKFFKELLLRVSSDQFCHLVLSDQYKSSLKARNEVECALYLDGCLHSLALAAKLGFVESFHLKWILAIVKKHGKPSHPSFSHLFSSNLQLSSLDIEISRNALISHLRGKPKTLKEQIYAFILKIIHYFAHRPQSFVAKFLVKFILDKK